MEITKHDYPATSLRRQIIQNLLTMEVGESFDVPIGDKAPTHRRVQVFQAADSLYDEKYGLVQSGSVPKIRTKLLRDEGVIRVWRIK